MLHTWLIFEHTDKVRSVTFVGFFDRKSQDFQKNFRKKRIVNRFTLFYSILYQGDMTSLLLWYGSRAVVVRIPLGNVSIESLWRYFWHCKVKTTKLKIILAMPFKSDEIRKEMLDVLTGYFKPSRANDHRVHWVRHLLKSQKPYR